MLQLFLLSYYFFILYSHIIFTQSQDTIFPYLIQDFFYWFDRLLDCLFLMQKHLDLI